MYLLDKDRASKVLEAERISKAKIDYLLNNFPPIDDFFTSVIEAWLNNQPIQDIVIDGIHLKEVMDKRHTHLLDSIRDMNKLLDQTLTKDEYENWQRILNTPIYFE